MEEVVEKNKQFVETTNLRKIVGTKVLTEGGLSIGRVLQVRINTDTKTLEGILVKRGLFKGTLYLGSNFFDKLSPEGIILNIEPVILLCGRKVVTYDGEVIGVVKDVARFGRTNSIKSLSVHSFSRGNFIVPASEIKSLGKSIILKNSYNAPKKSFWRRAS